MGRVRKAPTWRFAVGDRSYISGSDNMARVTVKRLTIYPLAIPMRRRVAHSAGERVVSDPVVAAVELADGTTGYGETLARPYVTGETPESVVRALEQTFVEPLLGFRSESFFAGLELIDALPWRDGDGRCVAAARAAVELALLDACSRCFRVGLEEVPGWAGLGGFGAPGSAERIRYSAVLASATLAGTRKWLRLAWWYGLRDFKLKVGGADDDARVRAVVKFLARPLARGEATLRLDANGAWTKDEAIERLGDWSGLPIASVEQPLAKGRESELSLLKDLVRTPLMHDESLVSMEDAERLLAQRVADGFNIRLSKCGGLLPSLRLAHLARRRKVTVQLGCMVGESSILSAAGRRFLESTPGVRFAEGWHGAFLLKDDVVDRGLRFGYGGRGRRLGAYGWGIEVRAERLERLSVQAPIIMEL